MEKVSLQNRISSIAQKTPDKKAVEWGKEYITYLELEQNSNRIANFLTAHVGEDKKIPVIMEQSISLIEGLLGIIKSGNIFVPIDPNYPSNRIKTMIREIDSDWMIAHAATLQQIEAAVRDEDSSINVILLEPAIYHKENIKHISIFQVDSHIEKNYLLKKDVLNKHCYIYFTSGSTGKPKGILGRHRSLDHFIQWEISEFGVNEAFRVSQLTSPSFDPFLRDVFVPLCAGGTLCIPDNKDIILNLEKLVSWIEKNQITLIHTVPVLFKNMVPAIGGSNCFDRLRYILLAGEILRGNDIRRFVEVFGDRIQLVNLYGPTETTLAKFYYRIKKEDINKITIPVGKPITFTEALILDNYLNKCVVNGIGEIFIHTPFISSGYFNDSELTKKVFIKNPFSNNEQDIIYKSGDMGRLLPDGNIEIIGRVDGQVKIRGSRIETAEVENWLLKHEAVNEAVVTAWEDKDGDECLCAYVTGNRQLMAKELREYLNRELPEYMVPSYFVQLDKMPLTPNGKIDRRALPEPDGSIETGTEYEAPKNETEEKLVKIWQEVLGIEKIGINDNFFELRGHSLKATNMVSKIHKELNIEVPLREVFKTPTIKGLSEYMNENGENIYAAIEPVEEKEYYELSSAQKRLYTLQQLDQESTSYNIPRALEIEGKLDVARLEEAFSKLIKKHEAFRTSFELIGEEIVQKIHKGVEFAVEHKEAREEDVEEILRGFIRPFDLSKAPLLRVGLIKVHPEKHILMYDMHHIISDGTSIGILVKEFVGLYEGKALPELRLQYKDYAAWQNSILKSETIKKQEEYWLKEFEGEISVLSLHTDYQRPAIQSFEGDRIRFELDEEITKGLRKIEKETGATMYMVLLAGFNILLSRYSGQEDIVVGSPIAGRPHADLENIMGMFVNTLAMRNYPSGEKTIKEFIEEVKTNALRAYENQDYQFEELVEKLDLRRDMSRNPVFDVMFVMQNTDIEKISIEGISIKSYGAENRVSKFDITLTAVEAEEKIGLSIEYCSGLFNKETIERMAGHLKNVLREIEHNVNKKICEIDILDEEERHKLLYEFNDTYAEYPKDKTIHELFEEQAERTPDNIAVVYESQQLTYRELNERTNRLARLLREKRVMSDSVIGIMAECSMEMIVGIIGILKAGGAYLPIDPEYPLERIKYMTEDSNVKIVIISHRILNIHNLGNEIVYLDEKPEADYPCDKVESLGSNVSLAYIIYTSGSTGKPKGVMVEHRSIVNTLLWRANYYNLCETDVVLQIPSFSFDGSVEDIFSTLITGGRLVLPEQEKRIDVQYLKERIQKEGVTHFSIVPSFYAILAAEGTENLQELRFVTVAGESCTRKLAEQHFRKFGKVRLFNEYGPTENSVSSTVYEIKKEKPDILIGKPISNCTCYIVGINSSLLQPIGVEGELCVSGVGLARGYLNRPELTAEKFIENPFEPGTRMYRSGDLARWLPDGNIEFLGRIDHQIKIRGFRIEIGEIESRLLKHEAVKEAVVAAKDEQSGDKYLCAYIVADKELSLSVIREYLGKELPDYMIPSYFIQLDKMPLTPNGKIDRKALPEPDRSIETGIEYEAPRNETEEKLVNIWQEVLGVEKIGINDNFFELGGHSLKATSMVSKIHRQFNVEVPLREVFKTPTIKGLAEYIKGQEKNIYLGIEPAEERECYELSSSQKRLYTLQQFDLESTGYNMPGVLEIEGKLDVARLEAAFSKLIKRHEAFRTSFELIGEEVVQKIHEKAEFEIEHKEAGEDVEEILRSFVKPFDLSKAPLLRAGLIKLHPGKNILMFDMHHIISDGTSMGILTDEFVKLYEGKELSPLRLQYKDYAAWQNSMLKSGTMEKQEEYWLKTFEGEIPVLSLPTDYQRPAIQSFEGDSIHFELDIELTKGLRKIAGETGATMYMVLLAGFNILLSRYSGQEDIVVGSPIAGRPHADLENIMGMFVNTLAMRNYPSGENAIKEFIEEVKTNALRAYENQDYQFEELVEKLNIRRDMSRNPLFDVMFAMQNMDIVEISIEGISIKPYEMENRVSKFDITLTALEVAEKIGVSIEYCNRLFSKETIERMAGHLKNVLKEIAYNVNKKICEIDVLNEQERHKLLHEFNDTYTEYPRDKTIHELFEEQAARTPDNIAVLYEDSHLTYRELNEKANQLARVLREKGVVADSIVGIMVERSLEMIIGIMGILKAGGAYLPIDPEYPNDRIKYMLEDSKAGILLIQKYLRYKTAFKGEVIELDDENIYIGGMDNLEIVGKPDDLAYVIYTSGSTGKPKGSLTMHYNVIRVVKNTNYIEITSDDKILQLSNYAFDGSTFGIYGALLNGAMLVLINKEAVVQTEELAKTIETEKITAFFVTTALFNELVDYEIASLKKIRKILFGGERVSYYHARKAFDNMGKGKIIHVYGPTEATVYATYFNMDCVDEYNNTIPIGKPLSNTQIYIVDRNNNIQPIGAAGELCISGDGLSRGYLNRPELTAEKFVENPFAPETRMYRTGDLARWLPGGNIEFLGRIDQQVKIRGFRIELGEIENCLLSYKYIKEAIVIAKDDKNGSKYLCAYLVSNRELAVRELREYISRQLPEYMIPSYFIQLEKIPLTLNGKVDKKALPESNAGIATGVEYEAPRNEIEEKLVRIWQEILEVDRIGIKDSFFELGGNSINIIRLVSLINKEIGIELKMADLFVNKTIEELSGYINEEKLKNRLKSVQKLNKSKSEENLFILHPMHGSIYGYKDLAKLLEEDFQVYGIQAKGLDGSCSLAQTIDEMVEDYINEIKQVQNEGPYTIVGYCIGNVIGYEITRVLEEQNGKIGKYINIDGFAFIPDIILWALKAKERLFSIAGIFKERKLVDELVVSREEIKPEASCDMQKREAIDRETMEAHLRKVARETYRPRGIIKTPAFIIKAEETKHPRLNEKDWNKMVKNDVKFVEIPGNHESIFAHPYVEKLADEINKILKES